MSEKQRKTKRSAVMNILYLVRGIPGSGKSTLANKISKIVIEADDYFCHNGKYVYDASKIKDAHNYCKMKCENTMRMMNDGALSEEFDCIAVANTFTKKWEMKAYYDLAEKYGFTVVEIICRGNFQNVHDVPREKVQMMLDRFEY